MKNKTNTLVESSYRALYGKLFSALFHQFGAKYVKEIEDAIQNSFYKSLKSWKPNQVPKNKENWLFIVARNDVLNQIKKETRLSTISFLVKTEDQEHVVEDLRLKTILFLAKAKYVSSKVKVIFILKNIFGLHIKEISECTLLSQEAIYKCINRAKKDFQKSPKDASFDLTFEQTSIKEIAIVEEILYAVFNIGFDSFSEKIEAIVNDDLCLEALALIKVLADKYGQITTKNLLALFCFHLARIPAKVKDGKIISFFEQDKTKWNTEFLKLGFHYLQQPEQLNKFYIEALIASRHMTATEKNIDHWNGIIKLYQLLRSFNNSPLMKLNLCYCLSKANRLSEAKALLEVVKNELPKDHIYFSLVKFNISDNKNTLESADMIQQVLINIKQKIRREYILENMAENLNPKI